MTDTRIRTVGASTLTGTNQGALSLEDIARIRGAADNAAIGPGAARVMVNQDCQVGGSAQVGNNFQPLTNPQILRASNFNAARDGNTNIRGSVEVDAYVNGLVRNNTLRADRNDAERIVAVYRDESGALRNVDVTGPIRQRGDTTETTIDQSRVPPREQLVAFAHSHPRAQTDSRHAVGVGDDSVLARYGVPNYVTWGEGSAGRLFALERHDGQFAYRQVSGEALQRPRGRELNAQEETTATAERLRDFQTRARPAR